jgi:hypothetical protein
MPSELREKSGYQTKASALREHLIPRRGEKPRRVGGERVFNVEQCEEVISRTEAKRRRLRIPPSVKPVATFHGEHCEYDGFRLSDCVPMRDRGKDYPPVQIDLFLAVFTANKSAKRHRDNAQRHYRGRRHGFAGHAKDVKNYLYELKDSGILDAYRQGRLSFVAVHGNLGVYRGEGYCFHSTLVPEGVTIEEARGEAFFKEAAPKGKGEARLKDAIHTLEAIMTNDDGFRRGLKPTIPRPPKPRREQEDWGDSDDDFDSQDGFFE